MMANANPLEGRKAKRQNNKPKDFKAVSAIVFKALKKCEGLLEDEDKHVVLKASHAVFQGATAYAKLYEVGEVEARLELLEESLKGKN
jgi:hypothetical protein